MWVQVRLWLDQQVCFLCLRCCRAFLSRSVQYEFFLAVTQRAFHLFAAPSGGPRATSAAAPNHTIVPQGLLLHNNHNICAVGCALFLCLFVCLLSRRFTWKSLFGRKFISFVLLPSLGHCVHSCFVFRSSSGSQRWTGRDNNNIHHFRFNARSAFLCALIPTRRNYESFCLRSRHKCQSSRWVRYCSLFFVAWSFRKRCQPSLLRLAWIGLSRFGLCLLMVVCVSRRRCWCACAQD